MAKRLLSVSDKFWWTFAVSDEGSWGEGVDGSIGVRGARLSGGTGASTAALMEEVEGTGATTAPLSSGSDPSSSFAGWSWDFTCLNFSTISERTAVVFLADTINGCYEEKKDPA